MHIHWGKTLDAFENQHRSSLNMCIYTQLLIFALWSFLRPVFKLEQSNLVQLEDLTNLLTVISMGKDLSYVAQYLITRVLKQGYCFGVIEIPYINSAQTCSVTEMNLIHVDHKDMGTMKY